MVNKSVILYGAGYWGGEYLLKLAQENVHVEAFCDRNAQNISRHYGCDVYTFEDALERYRDYPFVIALKKEKNINDVSKMLEDNGVEYYKSIDEFYQGENDKNVKTTTCGSGVPYKIYNENINSKSIIYSFGIGCDYTFEQELCEEYGATVYAFDPSPEVRDEMQKDKTPNLKYYPYGIADKDGVNKWYVPKSGGTDYSECIAYWVEDTSYIEVEVYSLKTLMKNLGHDRIDLLKMDVEGTEFKVLPQILGKIDINQVCIETHARMYPDSVRIMRETKELFNKNRYALISNDMQEQTYLRVKE